MNDRTKEPCVNRRGFIARVLAALGTPAQLVADDTALIESYLRLRQTIPAGTYYITRTISWSLR